MRWLSVGLLLIVGAAGCGAGGSNRLARPNWFAPGTAAEQRQRAQRFDPYPETDTGPDLVGVRPREYQRSIPETERARTLPWGR
jgi:hypothetical protein